MREEMAVRIAAARAKESDALRIMHSYEKDLAETPWWKFAERHRIKNRIERSASMWEQWGCAADMAGVDTDVKENGMCDGGEQPPPPRLSSARRSERPRRAGSRT